MSPESADPAQDDARRAALLLALDPAGLGGCCLRARTGPVRDAWLALLRGALPPDAPWRRLPLGVADERLLGGLDLAATLTAGRPIAERGLLAAADGGLLLLPSAERAEAGTVARIAAALDRGEVVAERDGFALRTPSRFGLVALDEGIGPDENAPPSLVDRLAFRIDLDALPPSAARDLFGSPAEALDAARRRLAEVGMPDADLDALSAASLAFGIGSLRAPLLAARAARASAALAGRSEPDADDLALAARLVLAPRATRLPTEAPAENEPPPAPPPPDPDRDDDAPSSDPRNLDDLVVEAVASALPAHLLERLRGGGGARRSAAAGGGAMRRDPRHGRPAGTRRGEPKRGARLSVVETLRAAAPWQGIRSRGPGGRLAIRVDDLRIRRFKRRSETTVVFVVDASGSSAFGRLAEAKGAVELLLADCYVRRDKAALLAFRGAGADILLPPTRSLARAKRSLAALPGGGGTPLAAAIDGAGDLAAAIARSGGSAILVFLTDGRANVARDGTGGRERAAADADAAARRLGAVAASVLFVDTSPRPSAAGARIADAMGARYLPMPSADAHRLSGLVRREMAARA